jgi:hypothetical protein
MTASRARNNDIGSDRENSRIGVRRWLDVLAAVEPEPSRDFLPAIIHLPRLGNASFNNPQISGPQILQCSNANSV